jgi:hypothetical protein
MRVLIVIALLVGMVFMILFVLANLARDLSHQSFLAPPDLDGSEDRDRSPRIRGDHMPDGSNALDDLHSAL